MTNGNGGTATAASSPFMSPAQAGAAIGFTTIAIVRLIARGALAAVEGGKGWLVRAADLDKYGSAGMPDSDAPKFTADWYDVAHDEALASQFAGKVAEIIAASFLPSIPRDAQGKILTTVNVPVAGALSQLIRGPAPTSVGGIRFAGEQRTSRFGTAGELYAAVRIRSILHGLVRRRPASVGGLSDLASLFESPARYAELTAAAVEQFNAGSIALTKQYPYAQTPAAMPTGVTITYRAQHASMGIDLNRVLRLGL